MFMFIPNNERNLSKRILEEGGDIIPLMIKNEDAQGWSQTNPSIIVLENEILANIRCVEYSLIHSDKDQKFWSRWGPLTYSHSENIMALKTFNVLCKLNSETLEIEKYAKIDTGLLDIEPVWTFHGLEDCRLAKWNNKLYGIGVRRDVKPNGEGRMQYQEIEYNFEGIPYAKELSRNRIEPPFRVESYCEKNWMPILDMPNHFVKWTNPTEIVEADLEKNEAIRKYLGEKVINVGRDLRGGSQVIKFEDGWLCLVHEFVPTNHNNELNWKDAFYFSRFVYWDSNWNIQYTSDDFSFLDGRIEFVCGMDNLNEDFVLITFGFCDCNGYVVKMPKTLIKKLLTRKW